MTYQFKYMDVPAPKAAQQRGFNPLKLILHAVLLIGAANMLYNIKSSHSPLAQQPAMPSQTEIASAAQEYSAGAPAAHVYSKFGLNPSQQTLSQAGDMAQDFISTGNLSQFETYAAQDLSLNF